MSALPAVLVLHGWHGSGEGHWQAWLAGALAEEGAHVAFPALPACDEPCPHAWADRLHAELADLARAAAAEGRERVVVAHSLGCVLWLREAARVRPEHRPDRVVLVAPPCRDARVPELDAFYPAGADAAAVRAAAGSTRLICSDDDPYCPHPAGAHDAWGAPLGIPTDLLPGQGHLNVDAGYGPWPAMLDLVLGRAERPLAAALP